MRLIVMPLLLALLGTLCSPVRAAQQSTVQQPTAQQPVVVASVEPLAMVLREIYGDHARVVTLLAPNQNPHHPMLSPQQVLTLRQADLLVWLGPDADPAVAPLVAARHGLSLALTALPGVTVWHSDVDEHGHPQPGAIDPHLWLSPANMMALAKAVGEQAVGQLAPGEPAAFIQRLKKADQAIRQQLAPVAGTPWLTYHQPWGYFQRYFGLADPVIVSRQLDVGPSSRHFVELAEDIQQHDVHCAIIEPEAQAGVMRRLCPDCRRVKLDPLGRDHGGERYAVWLSKVVAPAFLHCLAGTPPAS